MEIHHIVQQADGGDNSVENGIPLCFNCHAEAGNYNKHHPKGTKFSSEELRNHRDKWFTMVASLPLSQSAVSYGELDKRVAIELNDMVKESGLYFTFRDDTSWHGYSPEVRRAWISIIEESKRPDMKFADSELEKLRADFVQILATAKSKFGETSHLCKVSGNFKIKPANDVGWEKYRAHEEAASEVDALLSHAVTAYDLLLDSMRKRLILDLRLT